ncbi:hypothetical protein [Streptomyces sp. NPDC048419]|uniref:hypothetical protein n=1 Tax=Streptomyces sp. NPDC048419 TaxID=3365547 RepID=UPI00371268D4
MTTSVVDAGSEGSASRLGRCGRRPDGRHQEAEAHACSGPLAGRVPASGSRPRRTAPEQITLYKSAGIAIQDAAATALVLSSAREQSIGKEITLR